MDHGNARGIRVSADAHIAIADPILSGSGGKEIIPGTVAHGNKRQLQPCLAKVCSRPLVLGALLDLTRALQW